MKPFAWSYSALTRYENCPKQYYHINVTKDVKDTYGSEAGNEGDQIHKALFRRVINGDPLPLAYRQFEKIADRFAKVQGEKHGELKLALNRSYEPTDFFASDVYVRAIVDLAIIRDGEAVVVDWKTGKVKPDFTQLSMAAAVLSQYMPEIEKFSTAFVWLKHNNISRQIYTKDQLTEVWNDLIPRVGKIEEAIKVTEFPAKPSGLCKYCKVTQCPYWTE